MAISYSESTVWYIEARPWNESGFAKEEPVSMGSGVVVTFIRLLPTGIRDPRSYILTCAHVVRDGSDCLLQDIICYPPETGFLKTNGSNRRCGKGIVRALPAKVSEYSPCKGVPGKRDENLKDLLCRDWVLLEIEGDNFQKNNSHRRIRKIHNIDISRTFQVIGFPGGASNWEDGDIVRPKTAKDFRLANHSKAGMIDYEGPEETREGMSGGPILDNDGVLVGIHRSSTDAAMQRGGILADSIVNYLNDNHGMFFSSTPENTFQVEDDVKKTYSKIKKEFDEIISGDTDISNIKKFIENNKIILDGIPQYLAGNPLIKDVADLSISEGLLPNFTRFIFQEGITQIPNFIIFINFLSPRESIFINETTRSSLVKENEKIIMNYIYFVNNNYDLYCKHAVEAMEKPIIKLSTLEIKEGVMMYGVIVADKRELLTGKQLTFLSENNKSGDVKIITYDTLLDYLSSQEH